MDPHDKEIILDDEEIVVIAGEAGGANGVIDADEATIAQVIAESPRLMRAARRAMKQLENTICCSHAPEPVQHTVSAC